MQRLNAEIRKAAVHKRVTYYTTLAAGLAELGWEVEDVTAYRTVRAAPPPAPIRDAIKTFAVLDGAFVIREDGVVLVQRYSPAWARSEQGGTSRSGDVETTIDPPNPSPAVAYVL